MERSLRRAKKVHVQFTSSRAIPVALATYRRFQDRTAEPRPWSEGRVTKGAPQMNTLAFAANVSYCEVLEETPQAYDPLFLDPPSLSVGRNRHVLPS
jgi:hypothetical protein